MEDDKKYIFLLMTVLNFDNHFLVIYKYDNLTGDLYYYNNDHDITTITGLIISSLSLPTIVNSNR